VFRRLRSVPAAITAGTIALVLALFALSPVVLETIDLNWLDLRFRARGPIAPGPSVAIAAIDEKALAAEGRWPWPRSRIAALVEALARDGARVIAFDVVFAEAEADPRLPLLGEIDAEVKRLGIDAPPLRRLLDARMAAADPDAALAKALAASPVPVVLGYFFHLDETSAGGRLAPEEIARRFDAITDSQYPIVHRDPQLRPGSFIRAYAPQGNLGSLAEAAASSGYFSVASDPDGVVRWLPLVVEGGEDLFPPLSVLAVWQFLGKPTLAVRTNPWGVASVEIGERRVPVDEAGRLFLNYRGGARTFPTHSVADVLAGTLPAGAFRDRIVIVGATATSLGDIRTTPFGPLFPGPEVHANAIDNILAGDFIERPRWSRVFDVAAIVVLGLLVGLVLPRTSALAGAILGAALIGGYVLVAYVLFARARVELNMVYPILVIAATYTFLTLQRYLSEERERRYIKGAFEQYVAPEVIDIMLRDRAEVKLGGEERVLTALFSDLEGFTSFSEHRAPAEVIAVLGEYYGAMTEEVFRIEGTLIEYVGDELYAVFGAPLPQSDHARRACECALAMQARRRALNAEWAKLGRPAIRARTGLNTGNVLVGNVGSKYRLQYGAMGDTVNTASRLEGLNKLYGTEIIVSAHTAALIGDGFRLRELDRVRVKGRTQTLAIHELVGHRGIVLADAVEESHAIYAEGLALYRERAWSAAAERFRACMQVHPDDGASRLMERRCRIYLEHPPSADWGGAFEDRRRATAA
jgi:adenylate cyclase